MLVRISKRVVIKGEAIETLIADCYKEIDLPIAPFVGMSIWIEEGQDPDDITGVCYDPNEGILWASIGYSVYDGNEFDNDAQAAQSQFLYETEGWHTEEQKPNQVHRSSVWWCMGEPSLQSIENKLCKIERKRNIESSLN